jgi:hypothetical protein
MKLTVADIVSVSHGYRFAMKRNPNRLLKRAIEHMKVLR